jgi:hypothetical protein
MNVYYVAAASCSVVGGGGKTGKALQEIQRHYSRDSTIWKCWDRAKGEKYPDLKIPEVRFAKLGFKEKGL